MRFTGMPSTVIRRFDYHPDSRALDVEFVTGRRYRYQEVPAEVAEAFKGAFAKGRFFNARIRDHYACAELDLEAPDELGDWSEEWA
jgi:lysyl-tRNA synthetase class 2